MGITAPLILAFCSVGLSLANKDAYVMVELEPVYYGRTLVKRQAQYDQHQQAQQQQPQYSQPPQALDQQLTPEYYNYLQQLQQLTASAQQSEPQQQQYSLPPQQPQYVPQSLSSTAPQSFQPQQPPRRPYIPEDQRVLQESLARGPILNQQRADQQRQHLISLGIDPNVLRRQQLRENVARQQAQQAAQEAARKQATPQSPHSTAEEQLAAFFADAGPQQIVPHIQQQLVPIPQSIPVRQRQEESPQPASPDQHQRVSYSQISFGSNQLPKPRLLPDSQQQLVYQQQPVQRAAQYTPQPQVHPQQQVSYDTEYILSARRAAQQQAAAYRPQERAQQIHYHSPQQVTYIQPTEQQDHLPQQYLIETSKVPEQPSQVVIPRRQQLSYRPQANYQDLHASIAAQQHQAQLSQQHQEAATTPVAPSRSAIFVTTARTPTPKTYAAAVPEYRIQSSHEKQRPLTQSELNALINAGFSVTPTPNQPEYQQYFRGLSKRQNIRPPTIGRVTLSDEDREQLAKNGIRSLYRVQGAESRDAPITYVLALENQKRDTDKA